jgi:hypothetical protein
MVTLLKPSFKNNSLAFAIIFSFIFDFQIALQIHLGP